MVYRIRLKKWVEIIIAISLRKEVVEVRRMED